MIDSSRRMNMMDEKQKDTRSTERNTWYALRTFYRQEEKVSLFLERLQLPHFIPMTYSTRMSRPKDDSSEPEKPVLIPAVHNLLFVRKILSQKEMLKALAECMTPIYVFRHQDNHRPCEISDREMQELRILCDPQYEHSIFVTQSEAEAMVGKEVRVIAGPFKGTVGRLVRKKKHYYFLKSVVGMGVMVRISRWYCEPL